MIIRSQDKKTLVVFENIGQLYIDNKYDDKSRIFTDFTDGRTAELGKYSSEDKAIKVIDNIEQHGNYLRITSLGGGNIHDIDETFQMPLDEII